ncbi:anthranilate synthase/aminodeoxychorismate synthase-like glutamine amidotransferase [Gracilibacillus halotolerans]|uniref:Anthranilate synthase/aminodeoxychorismate synthase-like glutamine amidotransferase n=1 Tax=Gracilibacillus halotolerans TaxID=74386 RepID=A0A841RQU1_9BACI|nr:aminodeoxychorismate/anthranilate synthase component II [Gracilibacillus halotolerans]MBB6512998.1 anthranilate synthase/aminodeoxychorismate synthase-like glutamine amidotransferase [Gracilibacillus halotolerans]
MILLIDNYDSFTYNLYQYIAELGKEVEVVRNDKITLEEIINKNPEAIILSPGPGTPEDAGICIDIVQQLSTKFPILGICLGHQAIGAAYGAQIDHAKYIKHGKTSLIRHENDEIFNYLEQPLEVMRYHSLVIRRETLAKELLVTATAMDDGEIMAIKHTYLPVYGLQFHPESIGTKKGKVLLSNFFKAYERSNSNERLSLESN